MILLLVVVFNLFALVVCVCESEGSGVGERGREGWMLLNISALTSFHLCVRDKAREKKKKEKNLKQSRV